MASESIDAVIREMLAEGIVEPTGESEPDAEGWLHPTFALTAKGRAEASHQPPSHCGECWSLFDPRRNHWVQADVVDAALLQELVGPAWPGSAIPPVQIVVTGIGRPPAEGSLRYYLAEVLAREQSLSRVSEYAVELADAAAQFLTHSEAHEALHWIHENWDGCLGNVRSITQQGIYWDPLLARPGNCIVLAECAGDALNFPAAAVLVFGEEWSRGGSVLDELTQYDRAQPRGPGMTAVGLFQLLGWARSQASGEELGSAASAAVGLLARQVREWGMDMSELQALEATVARNAAAYPELEGVEPYDEFRSELREMLLARGWEMTGSDEESDFFAKGRLEVYACPADALGPPFHHVLIFEYPSEVERRESATHWLVRGDGATGTTYAYSLETALSCIDRRLAAG
jgi:hypothetical protein